jgi:hypothetical protein
MSEYFKQYYQENKDVIKQRSREWHHNNLEKAKLKAKEYYINNKLKVCEASRNWAIDNPTKRQKIYRKCHLKTMFNMTLEDFDLLFETQDYKCAICGSLEPKGKNWQIDHDHSCCLGRTSCGKCVRGILCAPCNWALGLFNENVETMEKAIKYVTLRRRISEEVEFNQGEPNES